MNNNRLTERTYWEEYYKSHKLTKDQITQICSSYDDLWEIVFKSTGLRAKNIIEIGAFPGRYIAYISSKYKLKATALDFNTNKSVVKNSFEVMDVQDYSIIETDFFDFETKEKYDIVYSIGFIEHFNNFHDVLDRHFNLMADEGVLLIMIPNKRNLRKWFDYLLDYENLKIHNLKTMHLKVFREFANRNNLTIIQLGYHGGFTYNVHQKLNIIQRIIHKGFTVIFRRLNPWIVSNPNPYLSSSIVAIFKK